MKKKLFLVFILFVLFSCKNVQYPDPVELSFNVIISDKPYQKIDSGIDPYSIDSMSAKKSYTEVDILFKDNVDNLIIITADLEIGDTVEITIRYRE